MTVASTLRGFRQILLVAVEKHAPEANVRLEERRGIILDGRIKLDRDSFIAVYFNALSGKTS